MFSCGVYETFKIRTTVSETCCFTWSVLLNKSHFWLKLVHGFCIIIYSFACQFSLHITAIIRSSRLVVFCKKGFLQTLENSQENTCARVLFLMKLRIHRVCNFIKKRFRHKWFSVNSAKFLMASFLKNPFDGCFYINTFHLFKHVTQFPAHYFLGLIWRLGTRVRSIFQTLSLKPIFNPVKHLGWNFFCENGLFNPLTPGVH